MHGSGCSRKSLFRTMLQGLYKVTTDALNIRSGPGTENDITGVIEDRGVYTIVQIENGNWGRLLSGAGWICLEYAKKI